MKQILIVFLILLLSTTAVLLGLYITTGDNPLTYFSEATTGDFDPDLFLDDGEDPSNELAYQSTSPTPTGVVEEEEEPPDNLSESDPDDQLSKGGIGQPTATPWPTATLIPQPTGITQLPVAGPTGWNPFYFVGGGVGLVLLALFL